MTERLYVEARGRTVVVHAGGIQGKPGPVGPAGAPESFYEHVQSTPAATWVIAHGIGRRVHVTILDDDGEIVEADVVETSPTVVTVTFPAPFTGSAFIS